ncbi:hypothetical protein AKJ65_06305 [candidate division MSBL1 archaeon SCGC-AAA259E19]|uniref:Uncharacterized protein n=1 Tax=candidate division MSBL1 archaeon SCGC-AAA259E19 TaxID=1698264 RepID=A0A133UGV2_9EURY|nr:hypothetical protein AKJ65_06305 [candidate division MSBL1 archaeon SCGC-AAA259E19]
MKINFPYGDSSLDLNVPESNLLRVLDRKEMAGLSDEVGAIRESLENPIGDDPLSDKVGEGDEIVVIVDDNTRPCPDKLLLSPLLERLRGAGVDTDDISIVIAYGLHPPLDKKGQIDLLGEDIVEGYRIVNHDPGDTERLGETSKGVPIEVNKEVLEADFRISTGLIEPHFFAGFSGGRKSIMPGVSGREAIYGNHGYEMIEDTHSRPGELEDNPIYRDSIEHADRADLNFILNVLLDDRDEIIGAVAGDPIEAHLEGVRMERERVVSKVKRGADIVITTNSGAPLDLNLYQTVKGIYHASLAAKDGGIILVASECGEGIGPESFLSLHERADGPEEVKEIIRNEEPIGVQWENQLLARVREKNDIYLRSSLDDESVENMMMEPVGTLKDGLRRAMEEMGRDCDIIAVPKGPMVIPEVS